MDEPPFFTEDEFRQSLRENGFLSNLLEAARPYFARPHSHWFAHARALNREALRAFHRREDAVIDRTTHDPICIATRLMMKSLDSFQSAMILYERGLSAEGDTLVRGVYEIAFWLGFLNAEPEQAVATFKNEEIRSQRSRARFYKKQLEQGAINTSKESKKDLLNHLNELEKAFDSKNNVQLEEVAKKAGLITYFDAYKHLSASSAHASLHSLHRYLKSNGDGTFNGHIWGPDTEKLNEHIALLCAGLGVGIAVYGSMIPVDEQELELNDILIETDRMRATEKADGQPVYT